MNFARLNHVLIPATKEGRDLQRNRFWVRVLLAPWAMAFFALSSVGRGLLGLTFVASLLGLDVMRGQNYYAFAATFSLVITSMALGRLFRTDGVAADIQAPARVLADEPISFRVRLRNAGGTRMAALRIRPPFLPWDGHWEPGARFVAELRPDQSAELVCVARFSARGRHHIDSFGIGALVPMGLAVGPEVESRGTRFIVWPRPAHVKELEALTRLAASGASAERKAAGGESLEILGLRPYRPGDPVRDLHARTWARLGEPVVRTYQAQEASRLTVVFDADISDEPLFEMAVSLVAGVIAKAAESDSDLDLVVLDDHHTEAVRLGRGRGAIDRALDVLACVRGGTGLASELALEHSARSLAGAHAVLFVTPAWNEERAGLAERWARATGFFQIVALEPGASRFRRRQELALVLAPKGSSMRRISADQISWALESETGIVL